MRAEQVSQETLGSVLEVLERRGDWARVRGEDGYEGFMSLGALRLCTEERARAWRGGESGQPALVLDATVLGDDWEPVVSLPWGARVAVVGQTVHLPDDRHGRLVAGQWVLESELAERFAPTGEAVVGTAREWMGVPYLWGGRTRWGADCSGYAQAIYRVHGVALPRDSDQQASAGRAVEAGVAFDGLRPGDLVFFRAVDAERIVHVALALGGSLILHAAQGNGQVREDDLAGESELARSLAGRVAGVRRLFG